MSEILFCSVLFLFLFLFLGGGIIFGELIIGGTYYQNFMVHIKKNNNKNIKA